VSCILKHGSRGVRKVRAWIDEDPPFLRRVPGNNRADERRTLTMEFFHGTGGRGIYGLLGVGLIASSLSAEFRVIVPSLVYGEPIRGTFTDRFDTQVVSGLDNEYVQPTIAAIYAEAKRLQHQSGTLRVNYAASGSVSSCIAAYELLAQRIVGCLLTDCEKSDAEFESMVQSALPIEDRSISELLH
jgi:hypothetical protein